MTGNAYGPHPAAVRRAAVKRGDWSDAGLDAMRDWLEAAHDPALGADRSVVAEPYEAEIARLRQALQAITSLTIPTLDLAREIARDALNAS